MSDLPLAERHEAIRSLLGAYALDATDPEETALVSQHLENCPRCASEVAQHHEVAGLLANSGGEAPAALWDRIADRLSGTAPPEWSRVAARLRETIPESEHPNTPRPERTGELRSRPFRVAGALVAAAAVIIAVALGLEVARLHDQLHTAPLTRAEQSAVASPSTRQIRLTSAPSSAGPPKQAVVVLTASGTGFVEAGRLSALPSGRTYQLWGLAGGRAVSLGLLGRSPSVVPFSAGGASGLSGFAITDEAASGAVQPSGTPVVQGALT